MAKLTAQKKVTAKEVFGEVKTDNGLSKKIKRAIELQTLIKPYEDKAKPYKDELKKIVAEFKELITDNAQTKQDIVTTEGTARLKITREYSIFPKFVGKIKKHFGEMYKTFVNEKVDYGCTAAFKALLADGDYKEKDLIREATAITIKKTVEFIPANIDKATSKN